jgi:hypothetical protein
MPLAPTLPLVLLVASIGLCAYTGALCGNLYMVIVRPPQSEWRRWLPPALPSARRSRPIRRCANSTGPGDVSLIKTVIAAINGKASHQSQRRNHDVEQAPTRVARQLRPTGSTRIGKSTEVGIAR